MVALAKGALHAVRGGAPCVSMDTMRRRKTVFLRLGASCEWSSHREADCARQVERVFEPQRPRAWREAEYARWKRAVGMLLGA